MAGGAGRLRGGRGSPVRVLHHGGWQRTSARPLWQAMIEGKAGVTGSPDPSGAEAEAEAYFGAKAPKPTLAQPDQSSLLLVRARTVQHTSGKRSVCDIMGKRMMIT